MKTVPPRGKSVRKTSGASAGPRGWKPVTGVAVAFVLGLAMAFALGSWTSGPDATERRIAEYEQAEEARDVEQVGVLTELARGTRDRLTPVLTGMNRAAPLDGAAGVVPTAEELAGWREAVSAEVRRYEETPSAGNGVNVARTSMRAAVEQLALAVGAFESALAASDPLRGRLVGLASAQRTTALRTWSVAALQLDVINIEAGRGHVHVQLPSGSGTTPIDGEPEGSGER
ncbi:hypothetical protein ACFXGA_17760 [Actinosynnema sp. NPDC059335]|uniref:hypothetical protein n=1 Tax=Actinosynnema sp. NPDC059335 TaxID=3346804 RepID=UPI003670FC53